MTTTIAELLAVQCPAISVGAISANMLNLGEDLALLQKAGIGLLHFDVMDGAFVPMLTAGPFFIKACKTPLLKDVHLMINAPLQSIGDYVAAGADMITVHAESERHLHRALQLIGSSVNTNDPDRGILRGLALNPSTPLGIIEPLLDEVDLICLIGINPGFAGQRYIEKTTERFAQLKTMLAKVSRRIFTCIDGGITRANISAIAELGADIVVSGSAIFEKQAIAENVSFFKQALKR